MTLVRHVSLNLRGSDSRLRQSCSVAVVIWFNIYIYIVPMGARMGGRWHNAYIGYPSMSDVCLYVCMVCNIPCVG